MDPKRKDENSKQGSSSADNSLRDLPDQEFDRSNTESQDENVKGGMLPPARRAALNE